MLVAIDVGNTQTVIGAFSLWDGELPRERVPGELVGLEHSWRISTVRDRTADEYALLLAELLGLAGLAVPTSVPGARQMRGTGGDVEGIVVSSSVPEVNSAIREMGQRWFDVPLVVIGPGTRTGMPVLYDNPREVGPDRIVDAVAALDLFGAPAIVVDLGTATTFNAISAAGEYLGGAIVPGIEISMNALYERAAALRNVELSEPRRVIGRSTIESIQSGALYGYSALVDGLCRRFCAELGEATIVATGGLSGLIAPYTEMVTHHEPWLTLHGLRLLYARNVGDLEA
jgi:type III pantothenate kinase